MRCRICRRPLIRDATDGLQIGPKCAKDRGLLASAARRVWVFAIPKQRKTADENQMELEFA